MSPQNLGAVSDILTADEGRIYMRNLRLDPTDITRPLSQQSQTIDARFGGSLRQDPVPGPQVVSDAGFLAPGSIKSIGRIVTHPGQSCWFLMTPPPTD
jgi:hypothetical protein